MRVYRCKISLYWLKSGFIPLFFKLSLEDEESSEADDDGRIYKNPRNSPSSECPRDEEQATLLGQKCLRKCSSHEDCKSKKKKCLCDGACGMSCIKPGIIFYSYNYEL